MHQRVFTIIRGFVKLRSLTRDVTVPMKTIAPETETEAEGFAIKP